MLRNEPVRISGDDSTTRDFCPVADVVQANLRAATAALGATRHQVFNVALGTRTDLNTLFELLRREYLEGDVLLLNPKTKFLSLTYVTVLDKGSVAFVPEVLDSHRRARGQRHRQRRAGDDERDRGRPAPRVRPPSHPSRRPCCCSVSVVPGRRPALGLDRSGPRAFGDIPSSRAGDGRCVSQDTQRFSAPPGFSGVRSWPGSPATGGACLRSTGIRLACPCGMPAPSTSAHGTSLGRMTWRARPTRLRHHFSFDRHLGAGAFESRRRRRSRRNVLPKSGSTCSRRTNPRSRAFKARSSD